MKRKWMVMVCLVLIVLIGGKVYMDKREANKEADLIEAERMSVEALKNTFRDIKSVKFLYTSYEPMPDVYFTTVRMSNSLGKTVEFGYSFFKNDKKIMSFEVVDKNGVQSKGVTTEKVHVTYSNGKEEEI